MARKNILELVKKYEQHFASGKNTYFDADEFDQLAEYYDLNEDIDAVRCIVDAGLKIHPHSESLLIKKGRLFLHDEKYMEVIKLLTPISSEYNIHACFLLVETYLHLGLTAEADKFAQEIQNNEGSEEMGDCLAELGLIYLNVDRFKDAVYYCSRSLEYNPKNRKEILDDLVCAYEMEDQLELAIEAANKQLDIDPYEYDAWVNLGRLYSQNGEHEKAIDAFDFALTIEDTDTNLLKLKAHCLFLCERTQEAVAIFQKLLENNPDDESLYFVLCESFLCMEMFGEAMNCIASYEKLKGETAESQTKKAYIYLKMGDYDNAISVARDALSDERTVELISTIGEAFFRKEMYDEAEKAFLEICEENGEDLFAIDSLSIINIAKEDYGKASMYTKKLFALEPDNPLIKERMVHLALELEEDSEFEQLLDDFDDEELENLFFLVYDKIGDWMSREDLIESLREARESRIFFDDTEN